MGANIAGIYGAQIFRADDAPRYRRGFSIDIAIIAFAVALAVFRLLDDLRRRIRNKGQVNIETASEDSISNDDIKTVQPSDVQPSPIYVGGDLQPVVSKSVR